jgi:hypothetical protein
MQEYDLGLWGGFAIGMAVSNIVWIFVLLALRRN